MENTNPPAQTAINESEFRNPANWGGWFGEFYFSKLDNRWFLWRQKRWMGFAVNLAHPKGVLYLYLSTGSLVLFGVMGLVLGIVVASWKDSTPATSASAQDPQLKMKDWVYPKSDQVGSSRGAQFMEESYSTSDPIDVVWQHYARLLGIEGKFVPNERSTAQTIGEDGSWKNLSYSTDSVYREEVRTATFYLHHQPGYRVILFLSSGKSEGKTHVAIFGLWPD